MQSFDETTAGARVPALGGQQKKEESLFMRLLHHAVHVPGSKHTGGTHGWRGSLNSMLHGSKVHHALNILLLCDLAALMCGMILELHYVESERDDFKDALINCVQNRTLCPDLNHMGHYGHHSLHEWCHLTEYLSVAILGVFLLENLGLIVANGCQFFKNPWHVLDIVVVVVSLAFELREMIPGADDEGDGEAVGLLVLARSWRFIRIGHGVHEMDETEEEEGSQCEGKSNGGTA